MNLKRSEKVENDVQGDTSAMQADSHEDTSNNEFREARARTGSSSSRSRAGTAVGRMRVGRAGAADGVRQRHSHIFDELESAELAASMLTAESVQNILGTEDANNTESNGVPKHLISSWLTKRPESLLGFSRRLWFEFNSGHLQWLNHPNGAIQGSVSTTALKLEWTEGEPTFTLSGLAQKSGRGVRKLVLVADSVDEASDFIQIVKPFTSSPESHRLETNPLSQQW